MGSGSTWEEATQEYYDDFTPSNIIEAYGGNRPAAIAAYAGIPYARGISKDLAYKSAQRQFQRWAKGQVPGDKSQERLNDLGQAQQRKNRPLPRVRIHGKVKVNDSDPRRKARTINKPIRWETVQEIARVAREEGNQAAWDVFSDWYIESDEPVSMDMEDGNITIF